MTMLRGDSLRCELLAGCELGVRWLGWAYARLLACCLDELCRDESVLPSHHGSEPCSSAKGIQRGGHAGSVALLRVGHAC